MSEVINIDFWQIWHFDVKSTGWVGLERSIIFMQTVRRFDMGVTPYTGIYTSIGSDEIKIRSFLLNCLNILQYI